MTSLISSCSCRCGCDASVKTRGRYFATGHNPRSWQKKVRTVLNSPKVLCACGCGVPLDTTKPPWCYPSYRRDYMYVLGHQPAYWLGREKSIKHIARIRVGVMRTMRLPEVRARCSASRLKGLKEGRITTWQSGLTKLTHPSLARTSVSMRGRSLSENHKKNMSIGMARFFDSHPEARKHLSFVISKKYKDGGSIPFGGTAKRCIVRTKWGRIRCDSSWESQLVRLLNRDKTVATLRRNIPVRYLFLGRYHTFFVDFEVTLVSGRKILIEVKNLWRLSKKQEQVKICAAQRFCKKSGRKFLLVTCYPKRITL